MVMNVSNQLTNRDQGGGPKKTGLVSLIGTSALLARLIKTRTYSPSTFTIINSVSVCPTKVVDTGTVVFNPDGTITGTFFSTDASLDQFRGCTKINGDLVISGFTTDEINFSVFDCLQEITGNFIIAENALLTTISGFVNLETVGGSFGIFNNAELTTVSGFVNLETVGGNLEIVGRYFQISGNVLLTTILGFVKLQTVGEYFSITNNGGSVNTAVGVTVVLTIDDAFGSFITTPNPKGITGNLILQGFSATKKISISQAIIDNMTNVPNTQAEGFNNLVITV